jgi:hypothetical protein
VRLQKAAGSLCLRANGVIAFTVNISVLQSVHGANETENKNEKLTIRSKTKTDKEIKQKKK